MNFSSNKPRGDHPFLQIGKMRLEIAYGLLANFIAGSATTITLYVRRRQRDHQRIRGRRRDRHAR